MRGAEAAGEVGRGGAAGRIRSHLPSPIVPSVPYTTDVTESRFLVIRRGKCSDERDTTTHEPSYPVKDDSECREGLLTHQARK